MASLPLAPGQPYVEVEYDYEYKSKDRLISIRSGDCFLLVKKTNEDWWQVRRDEGSKPFYVPAQYVREVRKALMPPGHAPSALGHAPSAPGHAPSAPPKPTQGHSPSQTGQPPSQTGRVWVKPVALELPSENLSRRESHSRRSSSGQRGDSPLHSPTSGPVSGLSVSERGPEAPAPLRRSSSSMLPPSTGRSPELQREPLDVDSHQNESWSHESESDLSSSSTEQLQVRHNETGPDSLHTNLQELRLSGSAVPPLPSGAPLSSCGDWDTHRDPSGRLFYVNQSSGERTWKPPRAREQGGGVRVGGEWVKPEDDRGRPLYLTADASRSEWELPKLNNSPPHLNTEISKTRSLDRRGVDPIVLTKWRHSTHIPEHNEKPSEKCAILNMTKITENGKKVRKNWTSSWTVLQGSTLLFTKGQAGGSSWFGGQSKPELTVDLRGASVDWAPKDRSSKKHVVELKTRQGTELLIQSDNENLVQDWLQALQDTICAHAWESDEGMDDDRPESSDQEDKNDKEKEHRDSKKDKGMKNSSSLDVSEHKTRRKLKKFLTRRPTLQAVKDKGYIKDQVFGCSLSSLCKRENSTVPRFVKLCIEHVETSGLSMDGLYRVSGNLAVIQKLRFAVNHDEKVNLSDSKWEDVHVTTGALKMFFRDLPEPLFPYNLFHDFISAIKSPDYRQRVQSIKDLIKQLPKPNHDTMQALFKHLRKVVDHGEDNRMTIQSVAIVFGPTLLRPETEVWNMAVHMVYQNQIVELILIECESIFGR
ncbi:rho GTPase-activating protein 12-like isoform X2 [Periophthalmus magnuspinnatus]|uniref:rho GTPase-activating protein 12-like isoform X2 n=1 Tax=Periophthalmus magnuspinnatus TaxID=409849 RepID=UPI00145A1256|nr:rho GTPase-activating protein 12-like isoform X2 [Periophthalmus magnuspinnatus]